MNLGPALGRFQYLRGKSQFWVEGVRQWIVPGGIAGGFANKVFDVTPAWSLVVALVLPVLVETAGFFWGSFLWRRGGVEAEYTLALLKDPFKRQSLAAYADMIRLLEQACRPCWERLADPPKGNEWAESIRRNPRPDER